MKRFLPWAGALAVVTGAQRADAQTQIDLGCTAVASQNDIDNCPDLVPPLNYKPTSNGCGPENGGLLTVAGNFVGGCGPVNFNTVCDKHDECYGTCNNNKDACDNGFFDNLQSACDNYYGVTPGTIPVPDPDSSSLDGSSCLGLASDLYGAVHLRGDGAFLTAQEEACECCGTLYCVTDNGAMCYGYLSLDLAQWNREMSACTGSQKGVILKQRDGATVNGCPAATTGVGCCTGTDDTDPPPVKTEFCEGPGIDPSGTTPLSDLVSALQTVCAQQGQNYSPTPPF